MFTRRQPRQLPGQPISAATLNAANPLLERLSRSRGPRMNFSAIGALSALPGIQIRMGKTGGDGIPAADAGNLGSSDMVLDLAIQMGSTTDEDGNPEPTAQLQESSSMFTAWNLSQQEVQPNTNIMCMLLLGIWVCVWEDCPPTP